MRVSVDGEGPYVTGVIPERSQLSGSERRWLERKWKSCVRMGTKLDIEVVVVRGRGVVL